MARDLQGLSKIGYETRSLSIAFKPANDKSQMPLRILPRGGPTSAARIAAIGRRVDSGPDAVFCHSRFGANTRLVESLHDVHHGLLDNGPVASSNAANVDSPRAKGIASGISVTSLRSR